MPVPLTVSCFIKIQIGFTFLVPLTRVVPDIEPLNGCMCVCVCECFGSKGIHAVNHLLQLLQMFVFCWHSCSLRATVERRQLWITSDKMPLGLCSACMAVFSLRSLEMTKKRFLTALWTRKCAIPSFSVPTRWPSWEGSATVVFWYRFVASFNECFVFVVFRHSLQCLDTVGWPMEEQPACKHWVMSYWCGYLSAVRCRLFSYGPAGATASQ